MFNQEVVRTLCEKMIAEADVQKLKALNFLLQAVISDDIEEIRLRMAFLVRKYGIAFKADREMVLTSTPRSASESKVIEFPSANR